MMENITLSASPGMVEMLPCRWITGRSMSTSQQVHNQSPVITFSLYLANNLTYSILQVDNVVYLQMHFQMNFLCAYYVILRLCCLYAAGWGVTRALPNRWFHVHMPLTVVFQGKVDIPY